MYIYETQEHMESQPAMLSCQKFKFPPEVNYMLTFVYNPNSNNDDYHILIAIAQLC